MVGGFDVYRSADARLVNKDINIQEGDMGRGMVQANWTE